MPKLRRPNIQKNNTKRVKFTFDKDNVEKFRDVCARLQIDMNVVIEAFINKYADEDIRVDEKFVRDKNNDPITFSIEETTLDNFKLKCKSENVKPSAIINPFVEDFCNGKYSLLIDIDGIELVEKKGR